MVSPIRGLTAVAVAIGLAAAVFDSSTPVLARQQPSTNRPEARAPAYSYAREAALAAKFDLDNPDPGELRRTFDERRARVLAAIPEGALLVFSAEQAQPRRLEFQVPHSENHDFIYLTGIEGLDSLDSALLLLPDARKELGRPLHLGLAGDDQELDGHRGGAAPRASRRRSVGRAHRLPRLAHHAEATVSAARRARESLGANNRRRCI